MTLISSEKKTVITENATWHVRVADYLSLERNVMVASAAMFLLGLGEERLEGPAKSNTEYWASL